MKWRNRSPVEDLPMGPKDFRSNALNAAEEALCIAFRKHMPLASLGHMPPLMQIKRFALYEFQKSLKSHEQLS